MSVTILEPSESSWDGLKAAVFAFGSEQTREQIDIMDWRIAPWLCCERDSKFWVFPFTTDNLCAESNLKLH